MGDEQLERDKRRKKARHRHRYKYWTYHFDKSTYECPDCERGIDDVEWFEVHHKDENPMNGNLDNLVGLCHGCHLARHGQEPSRDLGEWKEDFLSIGDG